jgi:hypothetical protein
MAGEVPSESIVALDDRPKRPRDTPVEELSPGLGEAAIGGLADKIMREVVGLLADRANEPSPLQLAKGGEKFSGVVTGEAYEIVKFQAAAVRCRPNKQVTRPFSEWSELSVDYRLYASSRSGIAAAMGTGELHRKQRVALALGKYARCVDITIDQMDQIRRFCGVQTGEGNLLQSSIAAK